MIKKIGILLIVLFSFFYGFSQNSLNAEITVPKQIGDEQVFTETLTIIKPSGLRSYAVFTQHIPKGFFIETKNIPGSALSYQNNILTITWMRLPAEKTIHIPIKISHINGIKGTFSLSGKLTYLIDNKKGEYELNKKYFTIGSKNHSIPKNLNEYANIYETFGNLNCRRKMTLQNDNSYSVELTISNLPHVENFILTEEVSVGFEITDAENIKPDKRIVQFKIKPVKNSKTDILKYRLVPENIKNKLQPVVFGKLSFIYNGQIINVPVRNQP